MLDFICFENLSLEQEQQEFLTINGEQKGVPKALTAYLGEADPVKIAWQLNVHEESPLKEKFLEQRKSKENYIT